MDELRNVIDVIIELIGAADHPLTIAMAAQIGRDDVIALAKRLGDPVPVAAMVAPAMNQQQWRLVLIAPIHIVKTKKLRNIELRGRAGELGNGRLSVFMRWLADYRSGSARTEKSTDGEQEE